jgi:hypothetical protein
VRGVAFGLRWRAGEGQQGNEPAAGKEHAMLIAFALALVGAAVIGSLELVAAHSH